MITETEADQIAEEWVARASAPEDDVIINRRFTRAESFGWVYFYNTRRFIDDGDLRSAIAGNAPIVVLRETGEVLVTGTAHPVDHYLDEIRTTYGGQ